MRQQQADPDVMQSVVRCFNVLEAFERIPVGEATVVTLARETGLSRPVVRRVLLTLESLGYAGAKGPRWELRPGLLRFARWFSSSNALAKIARPHVEEAAAALSELVALVEMDRHAARIVFSVRPSDRRMSAAGEAGRPLPLHASAPGQVLLAWSNVVFEEPRLRLRYTERTLMTDSELAEELAKIRADGYAIADGEMERGLLEAAVPVFGPDGVIVAALGMVVPAGRMDMDEIKLKGVPELARASKAITADLERVGFVSGYDGADGQMKQPFESEGLD